VVTKESLKGLNDRFEDHLLHTMNTAEPSVDGAAAKTDPAAEALVD
jgi:hypothetical protein